MDKFAHCSEGCTYFIGADDGTGLVRIGFTRRVLGARLTEHQAGSPLRLDVWLALPGNRERELQRHYAAAWQYGSWYDIPLSDLHSIV
jgi:hypothetical protein